MITRQVSESRPWPAELAPITSLLSQPISTTLCNVKRDHLSPFAWDIFDEMRRQITLPLDGESDEDISQGKIDSVLDAVLTTVNTLREYTTIPHLNRSTQPIWAPLISAASNLVSQDVLIMSKTSFLLPKSTAVDKGDINTFDGHAALLVSSYLPPTDIQECETDNGIGSLGATIQSFIVPKPLSQTRFQPLDGPIDGHILPGSGERVDCVFPVVCVADQDNIGSLVVSTVLQRYAWGMSIPVVGIFIETTGVIARLIIGWIANGKRARGSDLPLVHLASSTSLHKNTSLGIFDLTDPVSALQFVQFISSLRSQFQDLIGNRDSQRRDICWRFDHIHAPKSENPHRDAASMDWRRRISKWLEEFDSRDCDLIDSPEMLDNCHCSNCVKTAPSDSSVPISGNESTYSKLTLNSDFQSKQALKVSVLGYANSRFEEEPCIDPAQGRYSAFDFANLEDTLVDARLGVKHWLWYRRTFQVSSLKMPWPQNRPEIEVNEMINCYFRTFRLSWLEEWQGDSIPNGVLCDAVYRPVLESLFDQYRTHIENGRDTGRTLTSDESACVKNHLGLFLSAVSDAHHHRIQQKSCTFDLSRLVREPFDLLLNLFWCEKDKKISGLYFQNCNVGFAATETLLKGNENDLLRVWSDVALNQSTSVKGDTPPALRKSTMVGLMASADKEWVFDRLHPPNREAWLSDFDPVCGTADGLATIRVASHFSNAYNSQPAPNHNRTARNFICGESAHASRSDLLKNHIKPTATGTTFDDMYPCLVVKYQQANSPDQTNAFRQCQMCCTSAVEFLAAAGIVKFPVYGFVVSGTRVSIMMAWRSTLSTAWEPPAEEDPDNELGYNVIIADNFPILDIAEPLEAYRFAIEFFVTDQHSAPKLRQTVFLAIK
ncbi:hypothetical protein BDN70DRAFT_992804 [Pholiota conissans]|uniref:Uncharacterized protein n=1 Tax=Pholiota conissans TaxID=109636 RepID=A0A9P6CV38_9AGAR|nr:hypothetical protein BDN70DRAFT_992804 [Pholiota conissans]